ncbi:MAG: 3-oxoacyl-ACP reductase FabG [Gammaproteobacteria bacterium]|nr:3-oxoacyl-ACP reductase FabG [Gammaproteobacteria bacterium]MCW8986324.1 3-oxoacyl-ACP reductase FabG [Gammaproteobacteria bacterium]MCW9031687.1 3-oxoacyl-ACP reductase FabG [Gammaproteobacteria bacterium]
MTNKIKRALVTGGSGDIGEAICLKLAASGLHVVVHANQNIARADSVVEKIKSSGGSAESISFDITQQDISLAAIEKLLEQGPIQVLVNNAGLHQDAILAGMKPEQWNQVIDVNLNGFFNVTQPLLLPMMQTRWGRIINMSSIAGIMGNRGQANYAAAKAGLIGATKSLAVEVASRGITVNAVAPGIIAGSMTEEVFDKDKIKKFVPMNRMGTADEVASLVNFLASDSAGYISSQVISINGAMM